MNNKLRIDNMWTEGIQSPLGIDVERPTLSWSYNVDSGRARKQTAYQIRVFNELEHKANIDSEIWNSGIIIGSQQTGIVYEGPELFSKKRYYWQVKVWDEHDQPSESPIEWWEMGLLKKEEWCGAWIGLADNHTGTSMPIYRREFTIKGAVTRARAYISGLGHYELSLNGVKVGDYELDPGWTEYDRTCLYTVYDISASVEEGVNAVGIMLGNGFYNVEGGRYTKFRDSYGKPKCICNLLIEYDNGTTEIISTDSTWQQGKSPLTFSCIYGGEDYDASLEQQGWNRPGFAELNDWDAAAVVSPPMGEMKAQTAPPVKVMKIFEPVAIMEPQPGVYVFDLGQNFSGWPIIEVEGLRGTVITLTPAELLDNNGLADQSQTGSPYRLNYVLRGAGREIWKPRFTYYGFRYVQVEGAIVAKGPIGQSMSHEKAILWDIKGQMIYPDISVTGKFHCSDPLINRIHEIINWSILSNMKSIFTDCPHREKLGWLEQVHLMGPSIMLNYDVEAIMSKVFCDMADAQLPNGLIPTTAPEYVVFQAPWQVFREAAAWGGAYILASWQTYQRYGNRSILERHYEGYRRYIDYLVQQSDGYILREGLGDWYDIGPKGPGFSQNTPVALAETAIFYELTTVMTNISSLLGKRAEEEAYKKLATRIKSAFNAEFFDPLKVQYATGSDTACAMPLIVDLVEEPYKETIFRALVQGIEERGCRTTSGDVGHRYVLNALELGGRSDIIWKMSQQSDEPGYGYQIKHGATTLTEAWDGPTVGKSQNHFMLGHLEEWLYRGLAGFDYHYDLETEQFVIHIKPSHLDGLDWVDVEHDLRVGLAKVQWKREGNRLSLKADIPVNCRANFYIPSSSADGVLEDNEIVSSNNQLKIIGYEDGYLCIQTGSGAYYFTSHSANVH